MRATRAKLKIHLLPCSCPCAVLLLLALGACSEGSPSDGPAERPPELSLLQTGPRTVELRIAGPSGLRALQARLVYDEALLLVGMLEAGREARRIDRLFFQDLHRARGRLRLGLTDTRRVPLPARGALVALALQPVRAGAASLRVEEALGVSQSGAAVPLAPVTLEVTLP